MAGMRRFKVLTGFHTDIKEVDEDGNPKVYKKGQVVKSDKDLCAKFVNKFQELSSNANPSPKEAEPVTDELREEAQAEALAENSKKNKKKKVAAEEEVTETETEETEDGLSIEISEGEETETETEEALDEVPTLDQSEAPSKVKSKLGKDVTEEFPDAPGFKVFVKADHYFVAKDAHPEKAVRGPLTKKAVATELRKLHKE